MMRSDNARRVSEHRKRSQLRGVKRIEVTTHERDVALIRALTKTLRENGEAAEKIRNALEKLLPKKERESLVEFFQNSPLADEAIEFARDKDSGREIDL